MERRFLSCVLVLLSSTVLIAGGEGVLSDGETSDGEFVVIPGVHKKQKSLIARILSSNKINEDKGVPLLEIGTQVSNGSPASQALISPTAHGASLISPKDSDDISCCAGCTAWLRNLFKR